MITQAQILKDTSRLRRAHRKYTQALQHRAATLYGIKLTISTVPSFMRDDNGGFTCIFVLPKVKADFIGKTLEEAESTLLRWASDLKQSTESEAKS